MLNLYFQNSVSYFILGYVMENCQILRQSGKYGLRLGIGQAVFAVTVFYGQRHVTMDVYNDIAGRQDVKEEVERHSQNTLAGTVLCSLLAEIKKWCKFDAKHPLFLENTNFETCKPA